MEELSDPKKNPKVIGAIALTFNSLIHVNYYIFLSDLSAVVVLAKSHRVSDKTRHIFVHKSSLYLRFHIRSNKCPCKASLL